MDDRLLVQPVRCPGDAAPMVSVCRGEEGRVSEVLLQLRACQEVVIDLRDILADLLCDEASHRIGSPKHLEGVQSESPSLVLDIESAKSEVLCHVRKIR